MKNYYGREYLLSIQSVYLWIKRLSKQKGECMLKKYLYGACMLACLGFMSYGAYAISEFNVRIGTNEATFDTAVLGIESHLISIAVGEPTYFNVVYCQKIAAKIQGDDCRYNNIFKNETHKFAVLCSKSEKSGSDIFNGNCIFSIIEQKSTTNDISEKIVYIDGLDYYFINNIDEKSTFAQVIEKLQAFFAENYRPTKILFELKPNLNWDWFVPIFQSVGFNETTLSEDFQFISGETREKSKMFVYHVLQEN